MPEFFKTWRRLLGFAMVVAIVCLCGQSVRAEGPPRIVDKSKGEVDQIRLREEWFLESRREGTESGQGLWSLRLEGVRETREALKAQQQRWAAGRQRDQNIWVSKGPAPSTFGGWTFGSISGRIQAIAADWAGGALYAGGGSGGVWKSTNDGLSWTSVFETAGTLAVGAIHVDPNDSDVLWVGTGDNISGCESYFGIGLLRSPDAGATWELRNGGGANELDLSSFAGIAVDPRDSSKLVVGGRYRGCAAGSQQSGGIYSSDDGGLTWTPRLSNLQIHEIVRDPVVPDILWSSSNGGVHKSVDNGVTWTLQTNSGLPNGGLGRTELAIAPSDPDTVYVLFDNPSDEFWRTTDGGATWSMMNQDACDGQCSYNMVIRVDAADPNTVYRGTVLLFRSVNGGSSWTTLTSGWGSSQQVHQDIQSMLAHPTDPGVVYIGSDGGLWKTENGGSSFSNRNGNLNVTQFYAIGVDASDPDRICGGAQDNSSLATDGNMVWSLQAVTGDGFVCAIDPTNPNRAFITSYPSGGYPSISRSNNGLFGNFSDVSGPGSGIVSGDRINWVTPYVMDPNNPDTLYVGTHRAYRTDDAGNSWTQAGPSDLTNSGSQSLKSLDINRNFSSVLFSGAPSGTVYRTIDGGSNWTDISAGLPSRTVNDVAPDPATADRAFATVGGFNTGHVWEWNSGGGWTDRSTGLPNVPANTALMLSELDILIGMDTGVFRSTDGGLNWAPYMAGLPEGLVVTDLKYNPAQGVVTAGTYGRGAWQVTVGPVQAILLSDSVELPPVEVDGDGDDKIEPGETWSIRPRLRNAGGETAIQVSARLSSPTAGVTILSPDSRTFGDLDPGVVAPAQTGYEFTVDPSFACAATIGFDLVEIASPAPPEVFADRAGIFTALVQGGNGPSEITALIDEDFDPAPGWFHQRINQNPAGCLVLYKDEWGSETKDAAHGLSFHCGNGPAGSYANDNHAWLHPAGMDSDGSFGLLVPDTASVATLFVEHWYDTAPGQDGGQVVFDVVDDNDDEYILLHPVGGYPGTLNNGGCNPLQGQAAFVGSSGGWITSMFDVTAYKGGRIWPAFVFGSDRNTTSNEGWYIDNVRLEHQTLGPAICDVALWPGEVPSAHFDLLDPTTIQASWDDACNIGEFAAQTYSIQAGDLDSLAATGSYSHAPVGGSCDRLSTDTFTPGAGNEYYLIVPAGGGREGGAGYDSANSERPQPDATCGVRRRSCP